MHHRDKYFGMQRNRRYDYIQEWNHVKEQLVNRKLCMEPGNRALKVEPCEREISVEPGKMMLSV